MTDEDKQRIICVANRFRPPDSCVLDEANVDAMLEQADVISRRKLQQPLGPFFLISVDPDLPYDTQYSGWASLYEACTTAANKLALRRRKGA